MAGLVRSAGVAGAQVAQPVSALKVNASAAGVNSSRRQLLGGLLAAGVVLSPASSQAREVLSAEEKRKLIREKAAAEAVAADKAGAKKGFGAKKQAFGQKPKPAASTSLPTAGGRKPLLSGSSKLAPAKPAAKPSAPKPAAPKPAAPKPAPSKPLAAKPAPAKVTAVPAPVPAARPLLSGSGSAARVAPIFSAPSAPDLTLSVDNIPLLLGIAAGASFLAGAPALGNIGSGKRL